MGQKIDLIILVFTIIKESSSSSTTRQCHFQTALHPHHRRHFPTRPNSISVGFRRPSNPCGFHTHRHIGIMEKPWQARRIVTGYKATRKFSSRKSRIQASRRRDRSKMAIYISARWISIGGGRIHDSGRRWRLLREFWTRITSVCVKRLTLFIYIKLLGNIYFA